MLKALAGLLGPLRSRVARHGGFMGIGAYVTALCGTTRA
jgi:hypothetical protein